MGCYARDGGAVASVPSTSFAASPPPASQPPLPYPSPKGEGEGEG